MEKGKFINSRKTHPYQTERLTPIVEIPPEFRYDAPLDGGGIQVIDTRLCYNFDGKNYVECGSVWSHAEKEGFISPEDQ